jgi:Amt family ammonium transporter
VFAQKAWGAPVDGLLFGNPRLLLVQGVAVLATIAFTMTVTAAVLKALALVSALRATAAEQGQGLDISQHGEEAYTSGDGALMMLSEALPRKSSVLVPSEGGAR